MTPAARARWQKYSAMVAAAHSAESHPFPAAGRQSEAVGPAAEPASATAAGTFAQEASTAPSSVTAPVDDTAAGLDARRNAPEAPVPKRRRALPPAGQQLLPDPYGTPAARSSDRAARVCSAGPASGTPVGRPSGLSPECASLEAAAKDDDASLVADTVGCVVMDLQGDPLGCHQLAYLPGEPNAHAVFLPVPTIIHLPSSVACCTSVGCFDLSHQMKLRNKRTECTECIVSYSKRHNQNLSPFSNCSDY